MEKKIELLFENEEGKTVTISLDAPAEPVNPFAVNNAMDTIISQNIFTSSGGNLVKKRGARIVGRSVQTIELSS